ncbi:ABC transporter permease [Pedococcus sp. NPDC057267]|uniref:ABC transporter permease n=1 Tax=Pedococcus sp. NPDC057267 TaxID=3346077 RepID=UPI00362D533F
MDILEAVLSSAVRLMVPLLLAALGELISERAGVMNIGLEGYMTAGAFAAFVVAVAGWGVVPAILIAALVAAAVAAIMAAGAVWLRGNMILVGFALFVLLPGLANFLYVQKNSLAATPKLGSFSVPLLSDIPVVGTPLFSGNVFYWMAIAAAIAVYLLFSRTQVGIVLSAAGHEPEAIRKRGRSPRMVQTGALLACGLLAGVAGASLSLGAVGSYQPNIVDGRGLIAIAIVILGRWSVSGAIAGAFLIAVLDASALRVSRGSEIPVHLLGALPWVIVILMLLASTRLRSNAPRTLTK